MRITSSEAYEKWEKLSEEKQDRIATEAIQFVFDQANDKQDNEGVPFNISYLHLIALHESQDIEGKLDEIWEKLVALQESMHSNLEFTEALSNFNMCMEDVKQLIEKWE